MKFQKGNKFGKGRPKGTGRIQRLIEALHRWEKKNGVNMLEVYFNLARKDAATCRDLMSKLYPSLKAKEVNEKEEQPLPPIIVNLNADKPKGQ